MLNYTLDDLIKTAYELRASDIFIKAGARPVMRLHGKITPFEQALEPLKPSQSRDLCFSHMSHEQVAKFEHRLAIDLAFTVEGVCRIRANVYMQRQTVAGVFRLIPLQHWKLEELWSEEPEIPRVLAGLTQYRQGLILVTGPTGSGKSTTLAAMIDLINETRRGHIVTIEDPIEFVHNDKSVHREPARGGHRYRVVHRRDALSGARKPRHHPHRRDARCGDHARLYAGSRDGALGVLHGSHAQRV